MKSLKTRILTVTLLSAIALSQPMQLRAINLSPNQKWGLRLVAEITTVFVLAKAAVYAYEKYKEYNFWQRINKELKKKYLKKIDYIKAHGHQEQITVKKGETFIIERTADLESGGRWVFGTMSDDIIWIDLFDAIKYPRNKEKSYFGFKAMKAGTHTITLIRAPLESYNGRVHSIGNLRFIDCVTITVIAEDDAPKNTTAPSNTTSACTE